MLDEMLAAFPAELHANVREAAEGLSSPVHPTSESLIQDSYARRWGSITVGPEELAIPYRHYQSELPTELTPNAELVRQAWLTRSHDGRVRESALKVLLAEPRPWHVPFVVQLCGEHLISLGVLVTSFASGLAALPEPVADGYRQFWLANPEFIELTRARAASYWDAYYRGESSLADYPPSVALDRLEAATR